jgi:hypothetical protein
VFFALRVLTNITSGSQYETQVCPTATVHSEARQCLHLASFFLLWRDIFIDAQQRFYIL